MNLADAIRRAAQDTGQLNTTPASAFAYADSELRVEVAEQPIDPVTQQAFGPEEIMPTNEDSYDFSSKPPATPSPMVTTGTAVRLELFLTPDQLTQVLRSVIEGQHNVLTLREAAAYLRIPGKTLEQMAASNQVPAFQIDGRWRFAKPAVDEWMSLQTSVTEEGVNAA